jgi:dynein heavy chain
MPTGFSGNNLASASASSSTPGYKFDDEGIFFSHDPDQNDPHASYLEYIESLPLVASPSVFGMHDNAKI